MAEGLKRESKLDAKSVHCSVDNCARAATILHRSNPYCGKHALALLERGEAPDRPQDLPTSTVIDRARKEQRGIMLQSGLRSNGRERPLPLCSGSDEVL